MRSGGGEHARFGGGPEARPWESRALDVQPLVGLRTSLGSGAAVELSTTRIRDAARRRSPEGGVPLLWMCPSRGYLAPLVGGAPPVAGVGMRLPRDVFSGSSTAAGVQR
jgi:hypothetical protein